MQECRKLRFFFPFTVALLAGLTTTSANAVVISFESLAQSGTGFYSLTNTYEEGGFRFETTNLFGAYRTDAPEYSGSPSLFSQFADTTVTLTATNGLPFDLQSIDIAHLNFPWESLIVSFTGAKSGGGNVSESFTSSQTTYAQETFSFTDFDNVVSVQWTQIYPYHQFDDVVIQQPVPEPTSLVLWAGLGMMGLIAARRRRRTA